jgi:hypothetical protein
MTLIRTGVAVKGQALKKINAPENNSGIGRQGGVRSS